MPMLRSVGLMLLGALSVHAADWPQWLGPNRDGSSSETVAPWQGDLKIVWRQPVGEGHSSPVVANGKVYLHVRPKGQNAESLRCFDALKGTPLWDHTYDRPAFDSEFGVGPRATPIVADGKLFALGVTGILSCYDANKGGKPLWQVDTTKEFSAPALKFGVSASPLLEAGQLIVPVGAKGASVVAFDPAQGTPIWKQLDDPASYSSPVAVGQGASRQIVVLTGANVVSLAPKTGAEFWKVPFKDLLSESSSTPVKLGDVLIASSVTIGSVGLKLSEKDGKPVATELWKKPELNCYFSTPVPVGKDHVLMVTGRLLPPIRVTLRCVETATGTETWKHDHVGKYHAALLRLADGNVLMLSDSGRLTLLAGDAKAYKQLATSAVCGFTWAHPALANGKLYLRDDKELLCLDMR